MAVARYLVVMKAVRPRVSQPSRQPRPGRTVATSTPTAAEHWAAILSAVASTTEDVDTASAGTKITPPPHPQPPRPSPPSDAAPPNAPAELIPAEPMAPAERIAGIGSAGVAEPPAEPPETMTVVRVSQG
jgi:hypothetical protein